MLFQLFVLISLGFGWPVGIANAKGYDAPAFLVTFKDELSLKTKHQWVSKYAEFQISTETQSPYFDRLEWISKKPVDLKVLDRLRSDPLVKWIEPDAELRLGLPYSSEIKEVGDPEEIYQWGLQKIGWNFEDFQGRAGSPVVLAIADNAIDIDHPDLKNRIALNEKEIPGNGIDDDGNGLIDDYEGWDFYSGDSSPRPEYSESHGTHVAGIAMAEAGNGIGIAGVGALSSIRLLPIKVSGNKRSDVTMTSLFVMALDYARSRGAKVFSLSYPISEESRTLQAALKRAQDGGMIFVNSAGNSSENIDQLRGKLRSLFDHVIFVAASDSLDKRSEFSNYGRSVEIAAPGSEVLSLLPKNRYGLMSGTSMAAPHVSGALAVLCSLYPTETPRQILDRLLMRTQALPSWSYPIAGGRLWFGDGF